MKRLMIIGDYAGMAASALCLAHCLATPALVFAFPLLGLVHEGEHFHAGLLAAAGIAVLWSLLPGFLRHRDRRVLALGALGLLSFASAVVVLGPAYGEAAERAGAVASGLLLLGAHIRNRRLCAGTALAARLRRPEI